MRHRLDRRAASTYSSATTSGRSARRPTVSRTLAVLRHRVAGAEVLLIARDAVNGRELAGQADDVGALRGNGDTGRRRPAGLPLRAHPVEPRHGAPGAA